MSTRAQIVFHQLPASPALESEIQRHITDLSSLHDRITSCRVVVEALPRHSHGHAFSVHVDLRLPGAELVARHPTAEPAAHGDPFVAVRDAFDVIRRQLEDFLSRRREAVKHAVSPE